MKKLATLLLCLLMLISAPLAMASCGDEQQGTVITTAGKTEDLAPGATQDPEAGLYDGLVPKSYDDEVVHILNADSDWGLVIMDTDTISTPIDSAIFARNSVIEDNLEVDIQVTQMDYQAVNSTIYNQVAGNLYQYDICYNQSRKQNALVVQGVFKSANSYEQHLDFSKPWWYDDIITELTASNNLYLIAGDMNMMVNDSLWCMAFNVDIINKYGEKSPYDLVYEGNWTYEELYRLSKETRAEGKYGIVSHIAFADALLKGAGLGFTTRDEDGNLMRASFDDRFVTVYQKMVEYFFTNNEMGGENGIRTHYDSENYTSGKFNTSIYNHHNEFTAGNATFHAGTVGDMRVYMPSSEIEYGIVPIPKYEASQKQHVSYMYSAASLCGIPANIDSEPDGTLERVCTVMEWMCAYSYKLVKPVYYEVILYGRISRQPQAVDMLKIVFGLTENGVKSVEMDDILQLGMSTWMEKYASDGKPNISSKLRSLTEIVNEKIDEILTYYEENRP